MPKKVQNAKAVVLDDEEEEYEVEAILDQRKKGGRTQYLIKWVGYTETTWEDQDNISDGPILKEFLDSQKVKSPTTPSSKRAAATGSNSGSKKKRARDSDAASATSSPHKGQSSAADVATLVDSSEDSVVSDAENELTEDIRAQVSWEDDVESIEHVQQAKDESRQLVVVLKWKDGKQTIHRSETIHEKCPKKLLVYYEGHLRFTRRPTN
ncbi:uncharacterized protein BJ171DRAFT_532221 [Polychytrium aggregatum]|uniref:uncharacterized protein n=1 Tax=Polychytrium aggregatum TaxID=110093 RepID=UPI0022FE89CC|nr:uncharacterized protein BJ171DRAFT_532221 [Polychytrium aggregatum]KAI9193231.1 hypothetical protein BJ171DRAFT_532221 [Polychytrium aggregatum]